MTRICPNCGSPVAPGERFCGECGADLSAVAAPPENKAVAPSPDSGATAAQTTGDNPYSSGAVTNTTATPQPVATPPGFPQSGPVYANTPQQAPTYPAQHVYNNAGSYVAAPQRTSSGPMLWIGIALLALGLLGCALVFVLGMASAGTAATTEDVSSTQLGTWICSIGLLLLLGIPGGLLLFLGRRK